MPKQALVVNDFSGGLNTYQNERDLNVNELTVCQNMTSQRGKTLLSRGSFIAHSEVPTQGATISGGFGLVSFESDYSPVPYEAVDTSQSTNIQFVQDNDAGAGAAGSGTLLGTMAESDSLIFSAQSNSGLKDNLETNLKIGNQIKISGTAKNNGIFTIKALGDSINVFGQTGVNAIAVNRLENNAFPFDDETIAANSTTNGAVSIESSQIGESSLVLSDVNNGNLDVYNKSTDAFLPGEITPKTEAGTLATSPKYSFYVVDNAVRTSDSSTNIEGQSVRWYGYINRHHFRGVQHSGTDIASSKTLFKGWFEKDNLLSPPTDTRSTTSNTYPSSDKGFSIDYDSTNTNNASFLETKTWDIALSFIYDGNQESLLKVPTSNNTFTTVQGNDLRLRVMAKITNGYDARISGGRMYCKPNGDDKEPWTLLCDIDLVSGVSASVNGEKSGWTAASATTFYVDITLLSMNIDSYESINGYSPDVKSNSIGEQGEGWKSGTITNRRAFVANVKIKNTYDENITAYGDRIMFSLPNRFDTFPSFNFIDVVKGDAENYVKLASYADRLIALKQNSVQIVNVSSPSESNWFLESDIKSNGVQNPAAVFRSDKGILWANEKGFFIYNGSKIINLIDNKINQTDWSSFITSSSLVGYDGHSNMAMVIRRSDSSASNQGDAYIYDFKTFSWSFHTDLLTASAGEYTNFITDYNGDLVVGVQNSSNIEIKKFSYDTVAAVSADAVKIRTRDIDFGTPNLLKKIYSVTVTYKSDAAQTTPVSVAVDNSGSFTTLTGNFVDTAGKDKILRAVPSSIFTCQSLMIEIKNNTNSTVADDSGLQINDITIEYRLLRNANVPTSS